MSLQAVRRARRGTALALLLVLTGGCTRQDADPPGPTSTTAASSTGAAATTTPVLVPREPDPDRTQLLQLREQSGSGITNPVDLPGGDVGVYLTCLGSGRVQLAASDADGEPIGLDLSFPCDPDGQTGGGSFPVPAEPAVTFEVTVDTGVMWALLVEI